MLSDGTKLLQEPMLALAREQIHYKRRRYIWVNEYDKYTFEIAITSPGAKELNSMEH